MAAIVNDRDLRLQGTVPRAGGAGQGVILTGSSTAFYERADGTLTPLNISLEAVQLGTPADVTWEITGGTLGGAANAAVRTLTTSSIAGELATITAKVTKGGTVYSSSFNVYRLRDGATGTRGAGHYYATGSTWSDVVADMATPGVNVVGDMVTISNNTFVMEKQWTGTAWVAPGIVIDGGLLVTGSVKAAAIDTRGITVKDDQGNIILGAGTKLDYTSYLSNFPTSLAAINSAQGSKLNGIESGATDGATFGQNVWGQITAANAATYIANAAIKSALIESLSAGKINTGTLTAADINFASGTFQVTASTGLCRLNNTVFSSMSGGNLLNPTQPAVSAGSSSSEPAFEGSGSPHAFYAASGGYGPFTGSHDVVWDKGLDYTACLGDILVDVRCVGRNGLSNTLFQVERSSQPAQQGAIGVLVNVTGPLAEQRCPAAFAASLETVIGEDDRVERVITPTSAWAAVKDLYTLGTVNALGEGQINVCGEGGDVAIGDLIVTSSVPGKGMRQADNVVRGYTVARAREACSFGSLGERRQIACVYLCG